MIGGEVAEQLQSPLPLRGFAFVQPADPGVTLDLEGWSSFGQRATVSGTVVLGDVAVPDGLGGSG